MTINYTTLVAAKTTEGSIKNWTNNSSIPSTTVLTLAETEIYKKLRIREMLTLTAGTMTADQSTLALPTRYRQPHTLYITGQNARKIQHRPPAYVESEKIYDSSGTLATQQPRFFWADSTDFNFDALVDQAYTYNVLFYQQPAVLSVSNETNFLTDTYPLLLIAACLFIAYGEFLRNDDEKLYYGQRMETLIFEANQDSDLAMSQDMDLPIFAD